MLATPDGLYAEIAAVVFGYAERLDAGDLDGMAAMFAHGTFRSQGPDGIMTLSGAAEVRAAFAGSVRMHGGVPATQHVTTNLFVEPGPDADRASARSVFTVLQATEKLPLQVVIAGNYRDEFARRDGAWGFADRLVHIRFVGDVSEHLLAALPGAGEAGGLGGTARHGGEHDTG